MSGQSATSSSFKRKVLQFVANHLFALSRLFSVVALLWTLLLPFYFDRLQFFDENAFLGDQTPVEYSDTRVASKLLKQTQGLSHPELVQWVVDVAHSWNVPAVSYTYSSSSSNGTNVVLTVQSRRGTRGEALLVIVPLDEFSCGQLMAPNTALAMALVHHLTQVPWLAHDVVWLFAWPQTGPQHYAHLLASSSFGSNPHGLRIPYEAIATGIIRAAICLELRSYHFTKFLHVGYEGVNGELPNEDVLHSVQHLIRRAGLTPTHQALSLLPKEPGIIFRTFHGLLNAVYPKAPLGFAWEKFAGLVRHLSMVATGLPGGAHAYFRQGNIHGVTLKNDPQDMGNPDQHPNLLEKNMRTVGQIIEGFLRCANNLSEQLHASFFIYFILSDIHFVAFDIVNALIWTAVAGVIIDTLWLYFHDYDGRSTHDKVGRVLYGMMTVTCAFAAGGVVYIMPLLFHTSNFEICVVVLAWWVCSIAFQRLHHRFALAALRHFGYPVPNDAKAPMGYRLMSRCVVQLVMSVYFTSLTVWNPALCLLAALYTALFCFLGIPASLLYRKSFQTVAKYLHICLILVMSPEVILSVLSIAACSSAGELPDYTKQVLPSMSPSTNLLYIFLTVLVFPLQATALAAHCS